MSLPVQSFTPSYFPFLPEGRWGRLAGTGSGGWQAGRSPTASEAMESPLAGSRVKKGLMCSGKTCWLPAGYSARAVVRPWREAGGDVE